MTTDLPPPVGPTTIHVCLVSIVSYSCTTLSACEERERRGRRGERGKIVGEERREEKERGKGERVVRGGSRGRTGENKVVRRKCVYV